MGTSFQRYVVFFEIGSPVSEVAQRSFMLLCVSPSWWPFEGPLFLATCHAVETCNMSLQSPMRIGEDPAKMAHRGIPEILFNVYTI